MQPAPGLDQSWQAGLFMAAHQGLTYGRDVMWTYGPLGFLSAPEIWQQHLALAAFVYTALLRFAVAVVIYNGARVSFGRVCGFIVALFAVAVSSGTTGELTILFAVGVWSLRSGFADRRSVALAAAAGSFSALELLVKVSTGFELMVMVAVIILCLPGARPRLSAAALVGWVLTLVVLWLLTGENLTAVPSFVWYALQVSLGYASAMGAEQPGLGWEYTVALIALGIGLWASYVTTEGQSSRSRIGTALLWLIFWFASFKEGFVRHDSGHGMFFFIGLTTGFVAFRWRAGLRLSGLLLLVCLIGFTLAAQAQTLTADFRPVNSTKAFFSELADYVTPSRRAAILQRGRAAVQVAEPVDPTTLAMLRGHTVAVFPMDQAIAWAYGLNWDPVPVLQSYGAYTSGLDALDASFLSSSRAPQRILFEGTPGVDARIGAFDEGQTLRTMFCHYRAIRETKSFALLARTANRCTSPPVALRTVHAGWGQQVDVPAPPAGRWMVYVRIYGSAGLNIPGELASFFYRPPQRYVELNGGAPSRFVPGTAADGLPLQMSPGVDYGAPFVVAAGDTRIAILCGIGEKPGGGSLTYRFYAQRIS